MQRNGATELERTLYRLRLEVEQMPAGEFQARLVAALGGAAEALQRARLEEVNLRARLADSFQRELELAAVLERLAYYSSRPGDDGEHDDSYDAAKRQAQGVLERHKTHSVCPSLGAAVAEYLRAKDALDKARWADDYEEVAKAQRRQDQAAHAMRKALDISAPGWTTAFTESLR